MKTEQSEQYGTKYEQNHSINQQNHLGHDSQDSGIQVKIIKLKGHVTTIIRFFILFSFNKKFWNEPFLVGRLENLLLKYFLSVKSA